MITLLIADDQRMVREALAALLGMETDLEVIAQCADGTEVHLSLGAGQAVGKDGMLGIRSNGKRTTSANYTIPDSAASGMPPPAVGLAPRIDRFVIAPVWQLSPGTELVATLEGIAGAQADGPRNLQFIDRAL